MKRNKNINKDIIELNPSQCLRANRRKSYYPGKYNKELVNTLFFIAFVVMCLYRFA